MVIITREGTVISIGVSFLNVADELERQLPESASRVDSSALESALELLPGNRYDIKAAKVATTPCFLSHSGVACPQV